VSRTERIADWLVLVEESVASPRHVVVVLHGYAMQPQDLAPFARSMSSGGVFYFPEGPVQAEPNGRAWWPIDHERKATALLSGPRDLHAEHPAGAATARASLLALLHALRRRHPGVPLVMIGFSQGGMLALDTILRGGARVDALCLLSSSRICVDEWEPRLAHLYGLPCLVSHGQADADLAFAAGEALAALLQRGGATVTWVPFTGGHEIPLVVWRAIRKLLAGLSAGEEPAAP
jgi:phospholipase/carboxylesterase